MRSENRLRGCEAFSLKDAPFLAAPSTAAAALSGGTARILFATAVTVLTAPGRITIITGVAALYSKAQRSEMNHSQGGHWVRSHRYLSSTDRQLGNTCGKQFPERMSIPTSNEWTVRGIAWTVTAKKSHRKGGDDAKQRRGQTEREALTIVRWNTVRNPEGIRPIWPSRGCEYD